MPYDSAAQRVRQYLLEVGGGASRADLQRWGFDRPVIDRMLRRGLLQRTGRGRYALTNVAHFGQDPWQKRRTAHLVHAASLSVPGRVMGRRSAALAWQLPVCSLPELAELIREPGSRQVEGSVVVRRRLLPQHVTSINGVLVTTLARTAVDVALDFPTPEALVTVDAVVRRGVRRAELQAVLSEIGPVRGVRTARQVIDWADGQAESALESRGRGELLVRGVPRPMCNVSIRFEGVEFRVDDWWNELAVAAEADGAGKYDTEVVDPRALWREKLRQDWLVERLDIPVLRYVDREVRLDPDGLVDRINRKLGRRADRPWQPPRGVEVFQRPIPGSGKSIRWLLGGPGPQV